MDALKVWNALSSNQIGKYIFNKVIQFKAPYFKTIHTEIIELKPEFCQIQLIKQKRILNHLNTIHAIALCNLAELTGGLMAEVSIPTTHRWIPNGMQVKYLKKATTDLIAISRPLSTINLSTISQFEPSEFIAYVEVRDTQYEVVFTAEISIWVTPKNK